MKKLIACIATCVACLVGVASCALFQNGTAAETVAVGQCEHAMQVLKAAKKAGKSCEAGKAEADKAEPQCTLVFNCPSKDAGAE